ncbi:MAG TPA: ABC transporter permease subunit [Gemmataceae bacterium]|nr:ABC transporter permease subunit [Gemmataceae bacterium]
MPAPGVQTPDPMFESGSLGSSDISQLTAWLFLVRFSLERQARLRQMVWIALALLVLMATVVGLVTMGNRWTVKHWPWGYTRPIPGAANVQRSPIELKKQEIENLRPDEREGVPGGPKGQVVFFTVEDMAQGLEMLPLATSRMALEPLGGSPLPAVARAVETAFASANRLTVEKTPLYIFSTWVIFTVFLGFLLPIWSLSFATEALGGERETRSLIWLLTRPLPRWSIYLAKFVAILPWSLGMNLGGFAMLCLLGGPPGRMALRLYWPAVLAGTLAFCSLFHLMSALFRRAAVLALVYSFFLEWIVGNMPGYMKRVSISFYTRCLMFDAAEPYGLQPDRPSIYLPVSGTIAWTVLLSLTVALLLVGMVVFSRSEYQDLA